MKKSVSIAIISLTTVIFTVNAIPQNWRRQRQNDPNFDPNVYPNNDEIQNTSENIQLIEEIFNPPVRQTTPSNRGAGVIVTPDPSFTPTTSPQILTINEQNCTCVPYHMCDPKTNTVRGQENDDEVIGYGKIDIRFDPHDCQEILDVCCIGVATIDEPQKPVEPPKPPEAGCGVRNVGGLDFQVAGAYVSFFFLFFRLLLHFFLSLNQMFFLCVSFTHTTRIMKLALVNFHGLWQLFASMMMFAFVPVH